MTEAKFATITFAVTTFFHTFSYEVVTELTLLDKLRTKKR